MNKPRIFISTVTRELKTTRGRIADILLRKGYEPEWQDIFGTEHGDLRDMLRRKIDSCQGLIQIVGDAYGAEPALPDGNPLPDPQFGRCSYTQFEFLYAKAQGKKTWLPVVTPGCLRDTELDKLDLPRDARGAPDHAHPNPAAYQAERRQLQRDYQQRPEFTTQLYYTAESDLALDLAVERMDDKLEELREEFRVWQDGVTKRLEGVSKRGCRVVLQVNLLLAVSAVIISSVWWAKHRQSENIENLLAAQKFAAPRIRAHFVESTERQRDTDLAAADKAAKSDERQRLRETALAAHAARLARIDDAVARFAELESGPEATRIGRELTRILTDEGTDAALAFIGREKAGLLAEADAQLAADRERLRGRLAPLLSAADLLVTKGDTAAARTAYRELLQRDPAWPAALEAFAWFLFDQSIQNKTHGTLVAALADAQEAHTLATRWHEAAQAEAKARRLLSATHNQMGDVLRQRGQPGDAAQVEQHYTRSLELAEKLLADNPGSAQAVRDVSVSLDRLGDFLARRAQPGDADKALGHFTRSLEVREKLLADNPGSAQAVRDVSVSLNKLGDFLARRAQPGDADKALGHFTRCNELFEKLLADNPGSAQAVRDVCVSLEKLGIALSKRNQPGDSSKVANYFDRCVQIGEALLKANPTSGLAASDLAAICMEYGNHAERTGQGDAQSWWKRAHGILTDKKQKGMSLSPDDRKFLEELRTKVK